MEINCSLLIRLWQWKFVLEQTSLPNSQRRKTRKKNKNPGRNKYPNTFMTTQMSLPKKNSTNYHPLVLGIMLSNSYLDQKKDSIARSIHYPWTNRNNFMNS